MTDNVLIEKTVNRVHEKHEREGQHEKQPENNQRAVMFEFKEQIGRFDVGGLFCRRNNAFFRKFIADEKRHRADEHIHGVDAEPGVVG